MKEQLFDELLCAMQGKLTQEQISELRLLFYLKLEDYEIKRRCTEVALDDSGYLEYMLKFLTAKKVEGKSEGTLLQYKVHLQLMLETIRKPIQEIKTEDLFVYLAKYQAIRKIKKKNGWRTCLWRLPWSILESGRGISLSFGFSRERPRWRWLSRFRFPRPRSAGLRRMPFG